MIKVVIVLLILLFVIGLPKRIEVNTYRLKSEKVNRPVRISVIADLHCNRYGKEQKYLVDKIVESKPDVVVIPGDLFDVDRDYENVFTLISKIQQYPIYYVTGNHEGYLRNDIGQLCERLESLGVVVLDDCAKRIRVKDVDLEIGGLSDRGRKPVYSVDETNAMFQKSGYRILLSHRPDFISYYAELDVDLIVCGHDHGGQWRIPFTHQGLFAPGKGFFPKYTEGVHDLGKNVMAVSRGIASGHPRLPRLFNQPEVMVVQIENGDDM